MKLRRTISIKEAKKKEGRKANVKGLYVERNKFCIEPRISIDINQQTLFSAYLGVSKYIQSFT